MTLRFQSSYVWMWAETDVYKNNPKELLEFTPFRPVNLNGEAEVVGCYDGLWRQGFLAFRDRKLMGPLVKGAMEKKRIDSPGYCHSFPPPEDA